MEKNTGMGLKKLWASVSPAVKGDNYIDFLSFLEPLKELV